MSSIAVSTTIEHLDSTDSIIENKVYITYFHDDCVNVEAFGTNFYFKNVVEATTLFNHLIQEIQSAGRANAAYRKPLTK